LASAMWRSFILFKAGRVKECREENTTAPYIFNQI